MLAVFVNCGTIILGSLIGLIFSKKISGEMSNIVQTAAGVVSLVLGIQMSFEYQNIIFLAVALILGGIIGSVLDIDGKILQFGKFLEKHLYHKKIALQNSQIQLSETSSTELKTKKLSQKNFAYAFLNASVLFCVGAMAIIGSFKAGIQKDYTIIFTKSVLDGFMSIGFAASMGVGTAFSCIAILLYQGALTLLSAFISPFVTDALITELSAVGGCMIMMIGLNLLEIKKIKTANYLPSMILVVIFVLLDPYIQNIASQILK